MLNNHGFDLWADGYDKSVGLSDEADRYPFAGYKRILGEIYARLLLSGCKSVLDIGFGTGTLTQKLYEHGCTVYGQDFSARMLQLAQEKMPGAHLYQGDFSQGLASPLWQVRYDAIIATYSLHHLTDARKCSLIRELLPLLREVREKYPDKTIWCFTGFRLDDELLRDGSYPRCEATDGMLACINVLVDGRFVKGLS